ncbi:MAG: hypothetical protein IKN62_05980 [Elusimicrobia bacterium]|nr:hypothetical protein [Elusimicrobiota bacterium]
MNKIALNVTKLCANLLSSLVFWNKSARDSFRDKISPVNRERCVKYLSRYAKGIELEKKDCKCGNYIWTCWLQGEDNAPELVKKCFQSFRKNKPKDFEVKVITYDNLNNYLSLPEFIMEKHRKNIIGNAHFSDIIRVYLLKQYGGFWLDATCLLTSQLPRYIYNSDFFIYRSVGKFAKTFINNCFIYSKQYNQLISKWEAAITEYWKNENFSLNYFVHHYLFIALLENDRDFKKLYYGYSLNENDGNIHIILSKAEKVKKISNADFKKACEKSFIHKLTYKRDIKIPEI